MPELNGECRRTSQSNEENEFLFDLLDAYERFRAGVKARKA